MNRIVRLLIVLLLLSVLTACDSLTPPAELPAVLEGDGRPRAPASVVVQPPAEAEEAAPLENDAPPAELFLVRPEGAKGPLVAYDMSDGRERFALPAGMLSAYGRHYYAAASQPESTRLDAYDPGTGNLERRFTLKGQWALSGVSPLGRWLALTRIASEGEKQAWAKSNQWKTDVQIVDANSGETAHVLSLDGNFEVETISAAGDSLFLVQHLPAVNPDHYLIRLYDLSAENLVADPLRSKGSDEVMAGLAWEGLASPDGRWLLTLYLSTRRNTAFIHTLDLLNKYPVCIDLPSGSGDFDQLKDYTLALSPDGQKVYATNTALGVVAEVSLNTLKVARTVTFDARPLAKYDLPTPVGRSVVSKGGRMLYFSGGQDVWFYDTKSKAVSGPFSIDSQIVGLGLSSDGNRLHVASADGSLTTLNAASGSALSFPGADEVARTPGD